VRKLCGGNDRAGGIDNAGTVLKLTPQKRGIWTDSMLYTFASSERSTLFRLL
jgi:hypothetical protein